MFDEICSGICDVIYDTIMTSKVTITGTDRVHIEDTDDGLAIYVDDNLYSISIRRV
jgi:hypothetical protein